MAKPIPSADQVAKKWKERASAAEGEYVANAKASTWKAEAMAGEDNYKKAMQDVISKGKRNKGIEKSSDAKWSGGIETNRSRYSSGVTNAEAAMAAGMNNVLNDIKAELPNLGKRGPKGSSENFERSKKLGTALHAKAETRKS